MEEENIDGSNKLERREEEWGSCDKGADKQRGCFRAESVADNGFGVFVRQAMHCALRYVLGLLDTGQSEAIGFAAAAAKVAVGDNGYSDQEGGGLSIDKH